MGVFKSNQLITAASVIGKLFIPHVSNHANFLESDTPESFFPLSSSVLLILLYVFYPVNLCDNVLRIWQVAYRFLGDAQTSFKQYTSCSTLARIQEHFR